MAILIVVMIIVLAVVAAKLKHPGGQPQGFPYARKQVLFTQVERSFLGVLDQAVGEDYRVFGKVRVAEIAEPQRGSDNSRRLKALNRISSKHFDCYAMLLKPSRQSGENK